MKKKKNEKAKEEEEEAMYRSRFGEASQRLDGLGDESKGSRGGRILAGQNYVFHENAYVVGVVAFENQTHWVMWPKVKQIGGEDGWSKETQENKTAHCCEADVRIHYANINNKDFITWVLNSIQISL